MPPPQIYNHPVDQGGANHFRAKRKRADLQPSTEPSPKKREVVAGNPEIGTTFKRALEILGHEVPSYKFARQNPQDPPEKPSSTHAETTHSSGSHVWVSLERSPSQSTQAVTAFKFTPEETGPDAPQFTFDAAPEVKVSPKTQALLRHQFVLSHDVTASLRIARLLVYGKIRNQATLLRANTADSTVIAQLSRSAEDAREARSRAELAALERDSGALYFGRLALLFPEGRHGTVEGIPITFNFFQRGRRPPFDAISALLAYSYDLLLQRCATAVARAGLDPHVGFYHHSEAKLPDLALDLMSEFMPAFAEAAVITALKEGEINTFHFVRADDGVNLTPEGQRIVGKTFEDRLRSTVPVPLLDRKLTWTRAIDFQAGLLAKTISGELPDYIPLLVGAR